VALINESLAPSQPTDPTFHRVTPGEAPWVLKRGEVRLKSDNELDLRVNGLVIPTLGTPGPVTTISASLYCGADSSNIAADSTQQVPISPEGDARIHDTSFSVPSTCLAPGSSSTRTGSGRSTSHWTAGASRVLRRSTGERPLLHVVALSAASCGSAM
jgi:hypothetical protein